MQWRVGESRTCTAGVTVLGDGRDQMERFILLLAGIIIVNLHTLGLQPVVGSGKAMLRMCSCHTHICIWGVALSSTCWLLSCSSELCWLRAWIPLCCMQQALLPSVRLPSVPV
jgi:hypothetical protein